MPQLSLYLDKVTMNRVQQAARRSKMSASRWVRTRIQRSVESTWPEGYFDLQGSITDETFSRPDQPVQSADVHREGL